MQGQSTEHEATQGQRQETDGMVDWVGKVHDLPDIRFEKVKAVRDALRENRYDDQRLLDRAIERLHQEVGLEWQETLDSNSE